MTPHQNWCFDSIVGKLTIDAPVATFSPHKLPSSQATCLNSLASSSPLSRHAGEYIAHVREGFGPVCGGEQVTAEILPKRSCWYGFNPREQTEMDRRRAASRGSVGVGNRGKILERYTTETPHRSFILECPETRG
jgi:hypothetical protein